jgi:hypothetical protein
MNKHQRLLIAVALIAIGAVLMLTMVAVDDTARNAAFNTTIYSWETSPGHTGQSVGFPPGWTTYYPASRKYVFISHGLVGILLGLVLPIILWTAAAFVGLGLKGIPDLKSEDATPTVKPDDTTHTGYLVRLNRTAQARRRIELQQQQRDYRP